LYEPLGLYLQPCAKVNICVQLPQLKTPGTAISNWEVMEKLKNIVLPREFTNLKVKKSTMEFIRFEGEVESRSILPNVLFKLDKQTIKLTGFPNALRVRAAEGKPDFPNKYDWESFFRDARNMNQMKPGERPDTIHFQGLPCKWFSNRAMKETGQDKPSEYILRKVFDSFGEIRAVYIPALDPCVQEKNQTNGKIQTFTFNQDLCFEAYVQFKEYIGFVKAMDALKGMKLVHKSSESDKSYTADVKVDFDKSKKMTEKAVRHRELKWERMREEQRRKNELEKLLLETKFREKEKKLLEKMRQKEERREMKRQERKKRREQRRQVVQIQQAARQELVDSRELEACRLLRVLVNRVKGIKQREELKRRMELMERERKAKEEEERILGEQREREAQEEAEKKKEELQNKEKTLREKLLSTMRKKEDKKREKLRKDIAVSKVKIRSVIQPKIRTVYPEGPPPKVRSVLVQGRQFIKCSNQMGVWWGRRDPNKEY